MELQFSKQVRHSAALRAAYNALTQETYGFSFEPWYQAGYWGDAHVPYTLFDGGRAVSNVSVNRMELLLDGQARSCVQLGTVMTGPAYRGRGLSRRLMEAVLAEWAGETVFLFANESVLEFYPRFGFQKKAQVRFSMDLGRPRGWGRRLDMASAGDRELLLRHYKKTNPFSKIQTVNGENLMMFYCAGPMAECVFYLPDFDAIAVAEAEGDVLHCYDVYCAPGGSLPDILEALAPPGTRRVRLEFTPVDPAPFETSPVPDEEDAMFVLNDTGIFGWEPFLFPVISHT